jgi:hypothetical protein
MELDADQVQYEMGWADGKVGNAMVEDPTLRYAEGYKAGTEAAVASTLGQHARRGRGR